MMEWLLKESPRLRKEAKSIGVTQRDSRKWIEIETRKLMNEAKARGDDSPIVIEAAYDHYLFIALDKLDHYVYRGEDIEL